MYGINRNFCLFRWSKLVDTVTKIEYMSTGVFGIIKQPSNACPQFIFRQEQGKGINIALYRLFTNTFDGIPYIYTPVKADHISPGADREIKEGGSVIGKVDKGNIKLFEAADDFLHIWKSKESKIRRSENSSPAVKDL